MFEAMQSAVGISLDLLAFLKRHAAHVERIARGLEILGAAAVTVLGLLLLSSEIL